MHNYKPSPIQRHQNRFCTPMLLQRFHGEIGRTISDVQKRDEQTDKETNRQTKKLNVFGRPVAGEIRAPPNLAW